MTDQIPAGLTRDEASAVREWAEQALAVEVQDETVVHVARVLLAVLPTPPTTTAKENPELPDQTLEAQVRPIVAAMRAAMRRDTPAYSDGAVLEDMSHYIRDLEALLPAPKRPTLADMTPEERDECRGMQADLAQGDRVVILDGHLGLAGRVRVLESSLDTFRPTPGEVTPRPDLPRLEWPGTEKPAPALPDGWRLADHPVYGRVMVTSPAPDRDGYLWGFRPDNTREGADRTRYKPDKLTYIDTEPEPDQ